MSDASLAHSAPIVGLWSRWSDRLADWAHRIVMAVLFAGALVAGYFMLPGVSEKVAALEKDGQFRLALRTLEQQYDQGDRHQRTLFQMQRLYEQFGEMGSSRRILEQLVEQRPRDVGLNKQLAALYRQLQDEPKYLATVRTGLKLRYSEPACRELIGIWRRDGNAGEEERQINECRTLGYDRTEDMIRLAYLTTAAGKLEPAVNMLRALDDKRRLDQPREQLTLFSMLLELNDAKDAYRRGLRWFRSSGDETLALSLIDFLADEDRPDLALEFAKNTGSPGDSLSLAIPELLLDRGQVALAKSLLALWLERAKVEQLELADRFVEATLVAGDVQLAYKGAKKFRLEMLPKGVLVSLAEALAAAGSQSDFEAVRAKLTAETIAANPLLDAAIVLIGGDRERAGTLIAHLDPAEMDEWRAALLSQIRARTVRLPATEHPTASTPAAPAAAMPTPVQGPQTPIPGSPAKEPPAQSVPVASAADQASRSAEVSPPGQETVIAAPKAVSAPRPATVRPKKTLRTGRRTRRLRAPLARAANKAQSSKSQSNKEP